MKKILWILLISVLLCGCDRTSGETAETVTTPQAPTMPWVYESGTQWDDEGALFEVPVRIPGGMHYVDSFVFDGDLLFWNTDSHRMNENVLELALFDLDTGTCSAQCDYKLTNSSVPQALGDTLYICDNGGGLILQLDKTLNVVNRLELEPDDSSWYMSSGGKLYKYHNYEKLWVYDINSGSLMPAIEGDPSITYLCEKNNLLLLEYFRTDTGSRTQSILDLQTNELITPDIRSSSGTLSYAGNRWLNTIYADGYVHYLQIPDGDVVQIHTGNAMLNLLNNDRLLLTSEDRKYLRLYDLQGNALSECHISETGDYSAMEPIWCESLRGYFVQVQGLVSDCRLLFWNSEVLNSAAPALSIEPVSPPSDEQLALSRRAQELSVKYGVSILVGNECDQRFTDFTATVITDYYIVDKALDVLDKALAAYPPGFLAQLKCDYFRGIQIQLVSNLTADGGGREGGNYQAFAEPMWNYYLVVMDIEKSDETTYYHEFSHVIESYLECDSYEREDALFSTTTWESFNPSWFDGYTYDYALEREVKEYGYFVDSYSTINPTEDRARVMEYAMSSYGAWTFEDAKGLTEKLDYYCRCIRQAFDTTGWPEIVRWEQYLNKGIG